MTERHLEHALFGEHEDEHGVPHRSPRRPPRRSRRRGRRGRRLLVLVVAALLVAGAGYAAYGVLRPVIADLTASNDYPGPGTGSVPFVVADGDTGRVIAKNLHDAGVVKSAKAFLDAAAKTPRAAAIQPGTYPLKKQMSAAGVLAVLLDPASRRAPGVTVREGLWASEIYPLLAKATHTPLADYQAAVRRPADLGLPASAKGNVEGYLFPSTYDFPAKASAQQQLSTMIAKAKSELASAGVTDASAERTLTVASIIEGEVSGRADRAKVARVVDNRIADPTGPTKGFLQMDSTVNYALHQRGNLTKAEYQRAKSSPYDTYARKGLPPGPIGNPGAAAIAAAAHPAPGAWFYFVTVNLDTGETVFVRTLAEQQANEQRFHQWCAAHPGSCDGNG